MDGDTDEAIFDVVVKVKGAGSLGFIGPGEVNGGEGVGVLEECI